MRREGLAAPGLQVTGLLAALLLFGCGDERFAGTSTSVGDALDVTAALSDGRPAAGAIIHARGHDLEYVDGRPRSVPLDSARADSLGRFRLDPERLGGSFQLEILCDASTPCGEKGTEVFFDLLSGLPATGEPLRLSRPGSIAVGLEWASAPDSLPWLGLQGSDGFVQPSVRIQPDGKAKGEAVIHGVAPGEHLLLGIGKVPSEGRVMPLSVQAGQVTRKELELP